jgi:hypothetical protein
VRKLHISELSDAEISAVFSTAVEEAVARARAAGHDVPTISARKAVSAQEVESSIAEVAERLMQEARDRQKKRGQKQVRVQKSA